MKTRFYVMLVALIMMSSKNVYAHEFHYDVNNDGDVNITDAMLVVNYVLGKPSSPYVAVDLGLPSGTKWASCNVGATKPEEFGDYYAWGEITTKTEYSPYTYQYYEDGEYVNIGDDISGTQYDVARAKWGGKWRMPTKDEVKELVNNCKYEWTTLNGVTGGKFTGPNGNSIFLPAAGDRWNGDLCYVGERGDNWSSAQFPYYSDYAVYLYFYSGYVNWYNYFYRFYGQSVRPVVSN